MARATPSLRRLATHLMILDQSQKKLPPVRLLASFVSCEKLRSRLRTLMGNAGVRALLSRAHALAAEEIPWLQQVSIEADGTMAGLAELQAKLPKADLCHGEVVLLARLLGLLTTFVGEDLTLRVLHEVYPEISAADLKLHLED